MPKLSIIIPAYNAEPYINDLMDCLNKQITKDVEVIVVDDGSRKTFSTGHKWVKVIRQKNAGPGIARNTGMDAMTGDYFTFIDADDLIADNYISTILEKIKKEKFDYCYLSWKSMPGSTWNISCKLNSVEDKFPPYNLCVWNRVYKTATFGKHRFNPKKLWSEDADFIYRLNEHGKKSFISEYMYFYRSDTPDSWTKRMFRGELDYTRIVYNVKNVTPELLEEVKKEYENNEIVVLTNDLNLREELSRYAMVMNYNTPTKGMELRGDDYSGFTKIELPTKTQIIIWTAVTSEIGGIETFIYNFSTQMSKYYDIIVMYEVMDPVQLVRLQNIVRCEKYNKNKRFKCDTLIINRITDNIPDNITAKKTIQMVHALKMIPTWSVPQDRDVIVAVSEAAKKSYNSETEKAEVIHNLIGKPAEEKALLLISATRLSKTSAFEKGHSRMLKLADELIRNSIPYIWLIFSDVKLEKMRDGMIWMPTTLNIGPYLKMADYYVSLSDAEGFGYSMVEALQSGTPVISTPIEVLPEIGFEEEKNGYIVPFDMEDCNIDRIRNIPVFSYKYNNAGIIKQWKGLLGNTKPLHDYKPEERVAMHITKTYRDIALQRQLNKGEVVNMTKDRAVLVEKAGYAVPLPEGI